MPASRAALLLQETRKRRGAAQKATRQRAGGIQSTCFVRSELTYVATTFIFLSSLNPPCSHPHTHAHAHTCAHTQKQMQDSALYSLACLLLCIQITLHIPLEQGDAGKDRDQGAAHSHHNRDPSLLGVWSLLPTVLQTAPVSSNTGEQHALKHYEKPSSCMNESVSTHGLGGLWQARHPGHTHTVRGMAMPGGTNRSAECSRVDRIYIFRKSFQVAVITNINSPLPSGPHGKHQQTHPTVSPPDPPHIHTPGNDEPGDREEGDKHKQWQQHQGALVGVVTPKDKSTDDAKQGKGGNRSQNGREQPGESLQQYTQVCQETVSHTNDTHRKLSSGASESHQTPPDPEAQQMSAACVCSADVMSLVVSAAAELVIGPART